MRTLRVAIRRRALSMRLPRCDVGRCAARALGIVVHVGKAAVTAASSEAAPSAAAPSQAVPSNPALSPVVPSAPVPSAATRSVGVPQAGLGQMRRGQQLPEVPQTVITGGMAKRARLTLGGADRIRVTAGRTGATVMPALAGLPDSGRSKRSSLARER